LDFNDILGMVVEQKASDLFITADMPPSLKVHGRISPVSKTRLDAAQSRELTLSLMTPEQRDEFLHTKECNFAFSAKNIGRFRVSAFVQRDNVGMVLRRIETHIPTFEELGLSPTLHELAMVNRGIVFFVGATGTGKSTSLAAMVGYRNLNSSGHIISIEDPIEFIHNHAGCIVTQREVGIDTESYEVALRNTLRQAPNVILIGEIRTREAMEHAITFAETGHLVLTTLHANNANQALDRILHFFPEEQHDQVLMDLSLNLRGIIAQQLMPRPTAVAARDHGDHAQHAAGLGPDPQGRDPQAQGADEALDRAGHDHLRSGTLRRLPAWRYHPGRCAAPCRFVERGAPDDQAG
jgi:twitching motility protein PilU